MLAVFSADCSGSVSRFVWQTVVVLSIIWQTVVVWLRKGVQWCFTFKQFAVVLVVFSLRLQDCSGPGSCFVVYGDLVDCLTGCSVSGSFSRDCSDL